MAKEFNPHSQLERYTGKNFIVWVRRNIIAIILPALLLGCNRFFYVLARLVSHKIFHSPSDFIIAALPWERAIKLTDVTSMFIIPYYLAYVYWLIIPFVVWATMGKRVFYNMCAAVLLVELFSFAVWCFLPTKQDPQIYEQAWIQIFGSTTSTTISSTHTGFWKFTYSLCGQVYNSDLPDNLNPSAHNFLTFIVFCAFARPNDKGKMRWGLFSFSLAYYLLVATSTLMVRQHALIDVVFATTLGLAGFHFQKLTKFGHGMQKINEGLNNAIHNSRIQFKKSPKIATIYISLVALFVIFISFEIYFASVSLLTGDPFKALWDKQWNYLDYFH